MDVREEINGGEAMAGWLWGWGQGWPGESKTWERPAVKRYLMSLVWADIHYLLVTHTGAEGVGEQAPDKTLLAGV